jgi:diaminopimelate epimerase
MQEKIYKMSGAGNDFVVLDGRSIDVSEFRRPKRIAELCREYRTDGLMILDDGDADFRMDFYNPDGSGGMMCGNGGRCIVAFADWLGIAPSSPDRYTFLAPDGLHSAEILSRIDGTWTVKLKMIDVEGISEVLGGYFLNTGTRHFVKFVDDVDAIDIEKDGKDLRWNEAFAPEGTNVNFVQRLPDGTLKIRTFEKGVEGETLACGTGITASALAVFSCGERAGSCPEKRGPIPAFPATSKTTTIRLQARRGDILQVDFEPAGPGVFRNIHLTGPAEFCKTSES